MRKYYLAFLFFAVAFPSFSQNYTILGNSSSMGGCNCFRLTPDAENQAGAIFQNQTINLNNSFDFTFNVLLGCNNGNDAADGIVFVLTSNPNGLGNPGEGLGYAGGNQPFSIGVEFDTWENGNAGDPSYDHIGIESGGLYSHNLAGPVPALPGSGNIDNCQWYLVRIVWDVNTNTFSVYFNGVLRQQIVIPNMVNTYFGGNPVVNWGWSGATGGGTNDQQVCVLNTSNWVAGVNYQSCDLTMQFSDISTSSLGSVQSWAWNFGDNTTSNLQNPTHTYAALGTYTVTLTITDISGCTNTYTHPVTINPLITLTPTLTPPPCNGGLNGSVSVTPAGGFGPAAGYGGYMYNWNGGANSTQLYSGVPAGTYAVTVTDGVCTATGQYTLSQPPPLTASTSHTDANCGLNNGTATITLIGGTPPYTTVNWGTGGICNPTPTCTVTGLMWGTYVADFRDANGCSSLLQYREVVANLPCGYNVSTSSTNVSCWGGNNGTATVTPSGGSFPWTTTWTPGGNGNTITGLTAGTYNYSTNNGAGGQTFTGSVVVTQPGAAMVASITTIDMSCDNTNDGQTLANVTSGGVSPYTYAWSRGTPNGASVSGLSPGPISVVITDANGCTATASGNITGPPTLTLNVTSVDDSCYQSQTGSAAANVAGGNPPYLYYWSNISSAQTNLSLGVGTYTVTVTDNKGCSITGSATIGQPTPFTHTLTSTNILCNGSSTGAINITTSGGTPTPTYTWNPGTVTGSNPTGLATGQYNVTIADGNNCRILDSVVITQPATALTVTTSHTDVTCYGASDGTLTVTIAGGTPPYSYQGFPVPPGTTTIPGLPDSTYAGNVLDANGCSVAVSETISGPGPQSLAIVNVTDNICNGGNAGAITVNFVNATGTPSYNWNPGGVQPAARTGLTAGVYDVTASDQNNCTVSGSATVNEPAAPAMSVTTVDATCFGGNGSATANPVGGGTYNYTWTVSGAGNTQTVTPPAGTYDVTATDANLCRQTATFTINQPTDILIAETHTDLRCFGDADGTINLSPTGGTGVTYTYIWLPNVSTTNSASSLVAGAYDITVTDQANCSKSISVILTQPAQPLAVNIQSNNVRCYGQNNGSITVIASGGTPNYTFTWNPNVSTTNSATGLSPGNYSIIVADSNNCSLNPIISISEPNQPLTITPSSTNLTCYQSANGAASVTVSGGTLPYTYAWTPSVSTGSSASGLAAGNYSVLVTDFNGCTNTQPFVLTEPAQLVTTETHQNVRCFGEANGSIDVDATGGTPGAGYVYTWTPNVSITDTVSGIAAGIYTIVVTDSNNCSTSQTVNVTEPQVLDLTAVSADVLCNGGSTGVITAIASGGTVAYTYTATDGTNNYTSASGVFNNLAQGTYTAYVVDQNTCADSTTIILNEPPVLSSLTDVYPTLCYNSADGRMVVTAIGGVPSYTFNLSNGASNNTGIFDGLIAGFYSVTVTDTNGCMVNDTGTITQPDSLFVTVSPTPVEVKLGDELQITTTTNQSGVLTYQWNPDFGLSCSDCANPLFNGVYSQPYSVTVTNADGCIGTSGFTVTVIPNYDLFIPNAFSPNGDSENEYWQLFGNLNALKQVDVMVFNRIGEKVFESNDIYFKWDGTYKGERVPPGVYVYVTRFVWLNNHSDYDYTGSITVLR